MDEELGKIIRPILLRSFQLIITGVIYRAFQIMEESKKAWADAIKLQTTPEAILVMLVSV